MFCIYIFVFIYNIPHIFLSTLTGNICRGYAVGVTFTKFYSWFSFVLNAALPFISLCFMNYNIICRVRESCRMSGDTEFIEEVQGHQKGQGHGQDQNNVMITERENKFKNIETQFIIMLLLVTTLFLILMIPSYIRYLYSPFLEGNTPAKYAFLVFFSHFSHKFYNTNNGINIFSYCMSGQKFRNDLKEILGFGRKSHLNKERPQTSTVEISSIS